MQLGTCFLNKNVFFADAEDYKLLVTSKAWSAPFVASGAPIVAMPLVPFVALLDEDYTNSTSPNYWAKLGGSVGGTFLANVTDPSAALWDLQARGRRSLLPAGRMKQGHRY